MARVSRRRARRFLAAPLAVVALGASCGDDGSDAPSSFGSHATQVSAPSPATVPPVGDPRYDEALARGIAFALPGLSVQDPGTLYLAANIGQRYRLRDFAELRAVADDRLEQPAPDGAPAGQEMTHAQLQVLWRRSGAPGEPAPPGLLDSLPRTSYLDRVAWLTASAAHCGTDTFPAPEWERLARQAFDEPDPDGYLQTHVAIGLVVIEQRGCTLPWLDELQDRAAVALAEGLDGTHVVSDINLERLVLLVELDRRDEVDPAWIGRVLESQQPDGGWRAHGGYGPLVDPDDPTSHWHPTLVAVWLLAAWTDPDAPATPPLL
jgi:hypothetical protein